MSTNANFFSVYHWNKIKIYFSFPLFSVKSAKEKYEIAVEEIVEGLNLAETDKQVSAKFTMNNEMIVEGIYN